jgi:hypothetical protein
MLFGVKWWLPNMTAAGGVGVPRKLRILMGEFMEINSPRLAFVLESFVLFGGGWISGEILA